MLCKKNPSLELARFHLKKKSATTILSQQKTDYTATDRAGGYLSNFRLLGTVCILQGFGTDVCPTWGYLGLCVLQSFGREVFLIWGYLGQRSRGCVYRIRPARGKQGPRRNLSIESIAFLFTSFNLRCARGETTVLPNPLLPEVWRPGLGGGGCARPLGLPLR